MKEKFKALSLYYKTFILSALISLILFLSMIPLIIYHHPDISVGLLFGEFINFASYFILGIIENKKYEDKKKTKLMVVIIISRFVILVASSIIFGFLYYRYDHHIFNIVALIGGYFIPLIIFIILNLLQRKERLNV